jgi:hypothetical protein
MSDGATAVPVPDETAPLWPEKGGSTPGSSKSPHPLPPSYSPRTAFAIDVLSFMFAEVQHMGALTAIYLHAHAEEGSGGLDMSLSRTGVIMALMYGARLVLKSGVICALRSAIGIHAVAGVEARPSG